MKIRDLLASIIDFEPYVGGIDDAFDSLTDPILETNVTHVEHDHSKVDRTAVFVAIAGTSIDSHAFIEDARAKSAALVVGQRSHRTNRESDVTFDSTRAVIGPMASSLHGQPSRKMTLVGITGTNGKTTCSYLYTSMVQKNNLSSFTMGTTGIFVNGEKEADSQTTPDPVIIHKYLADFLGDGIEYGAMEVSSHALDQSRVLGVHFSAVAFTNFTQDHMDYHKTMEEYFNAKMSLFSKRFSNCAVINTDCDLDGRVQAIARDQKMHIYTASIKDRNANVYVEAQKVSLEGTHLKIEINDGEKKSTYTCMTPLISQFNQENIAVALGLALATRLDMGKSVMALEDPLAVPGRLQRPNVQTPFSIFVDYAHTPDALERVLVTMRPLAKKTIVVFGCGGNRDKAKRPIMGRIASQNADIVIVTNDNPRKEDPQSIVSEILEGATSEVIVELDRRLAIRKALLSAREGDAVIIAGKGHETGQEFIDHTEAFCDVEVVEELVKELELT